MRLVSLDWLRVILILAIFFHHALLPFVSSSWLVANDKTLPQLETIMVYFEQIRLQLLFFIAGVGSYILLNKKSVGYFIKDKFKRLFIPLIVALIVVVPPQLYVTNALSFTSGVALDTWAKAFAFQLTEFKLLHLWFIKFLLLFMLLAIPMRFFIASNLGQLFLSQLSRFISWRFGLFSLAFMLIVFKLGFRVVFGESQAEYWDVWRMLYYSFFFFMGFILVSQTQLWQQLACQKRTSALLLLLSSLFFYVSYFSIDSESFLGKIGSLWVISCFLLSWAAVLTIVGYGESLFKSAPKWLIKLNELIYPFYIFHQMVIVVLAYFVVSMPIAFLAKMLLVIVGSLGITLFLCYVVIRPFNLTRFLFGLKPK